MLRDVNFLGAYRFDAPPACDEIVVFLFPSHTTKKLSPTSIVFQGYAQHLPLPLTGIGTPFSISIMSLDTAFLVQLAQTLQARDSPDAPTDCSMPLACTRNTPQPVQPRMVSRLASSAATCRVCPDRRLRASFAQCLYSDRTRLVFFSRPFAKFSRSCSACQHDFRQSPHATRLQKRRLKVRRVQCRL